STNPTTTTPASPPGSAWSRWTDGGPQMSATSPPSAPAPRAAARLVGVSKSFGAKQAVRHMDLTLHAGEVFAFLGPNGAGKTTTLKITTGLLRPDQGQVEVCGYDMARDPHSAKQRLAFVPDQPFLYDKLTGR